MAGTNEPRTRQPYQEPKTDCNFKWDENSQLYYHSSTGFYYNPQEQWYYSSRDGLYYKFENGNYVLLGLNSDQADQGETSDDGERVGSRSFAEKKQSMSIDSFKEDCEDLAKRIGTVTDEHTNDDLEYVDNQATEGPPPPSEWLEDTLIDLYLSGYTNQADATASDMMIPIVTNGIDSLDAAADGAGENDSCELEEGEWIPDDDFGSIHSNQNVADTGTSWEEENWLAQYGQVTEGNEDSDLDIQIVDLWDWEMIRGTKKDGKSNVARLVGRLVKDSSKLHPSVPSGRVRLKTAPIREAHLDLILVTSGQIYRLRRPSLRYLASVLTYDSSNPTKDWGFPQLSINRQIQQLRELDGHGAIVEASVSANHPPALRKEKHQYPYRDRAAERRTLHGGFGVGPGQKKVSNAADSAPSSPTSACPQEAAAESLSISFGAGSYARKLLESMGWKEGEALGRSTKGLVEPLQAVGNKGNAGLGWDNGRKKQSWYNGQ